MKNLTKSALLTSGLLLSVFVINSCKKQAVDNETQSVVDNSVAEQEFMHVSPTINARAVNNPGVKKLIAGVYSSCPTITISGDTTWQNTNNPPTMTLDYGTTPCVDVDGRLRTGQMYVAFSKPWDSVGCVMTVTFSNFYSNSVKYEGTVVITRLSGMPQPSFRTQVIGGKCTGSGWVISYDCDRTLTMTQGGNTPLVEADDVYTLNGSSSGTNRNGKHFVVTTNNLTKAASCKWISSGTLELTPDGLAKRTVDYGNGTCDDKATFTVNGNTFQFTMN